MQAGGVSALPPVHCSLSRDWAADSEAILDYMEDDSSQHSMSTVTWLRLQS